MTADHYEAIIIGGGYNGLIAVAYLARAKKKGACWSGVRWHIAFYHQSKHSLINFYFRLKQ